MSNSIVLPEVGAIIKSFDFVGHDDSYMIGRVTKVQGTYIECEMIKQVYAGSEVKDATMFRTQAQGTGFMDDKFERVVILG